MVGNFAAEDLMRLTAVNSVDVAMLLAHVNPDVVMAHFPREDLRVNPSPEVVAVKVAQVCVLHVPDDNKHPVVVPVDWSTVMMDFVGIVVGTCKRKQRQLRVFMKICVYIGTNQYDGRCPRFLMKFIHQFRIYFRHALRTNLSGCTRGSYSRWCSSFGRVPDV